MTKSLKTKTLKGVGWSAADALLGQGITFLVGLILARLLSPVEYGLIGICLIFNTVLSGIVDSGLSNALIRKQEVTDEDYNTMFITNLIISFILYIALFFCSPFIANFFDRQELTTLARAMGLILIIQALSITQVTVLTKRLDFRTKTKASLIAALTSGVVGIGMALCGFGVWALVGQQLSNKILYTICLWVFNRWWPNLFFSILSFNYMWGFGWKLMLSGLLNNIWNQLYQVVVGKFYSPATLGQYSRSKEFANIFSANITIIVQRVSYPVLAGIQDDKERMVAAYRKVIKMTMFVTCISMIYLGAVAEPLINCLIGRQWHEASTFLPLICISMSLYPLHVINLNMLQVQGRSDVFLYLEITKKIIALGPICIGIFVGIYYMLMASIVVGIISFFLNSYYTGKKLGYSSWIQIKDVIPSYVISFIIAIPVYFFKYLTIPNCYILSLQFIIGASVGIVTCEILQLEEYKEVKSIFITIFNKIRYKGVTGRNKI